MPEELNRVLTDHASDLLLCSSAAPAAILRGERVAGAIEVVGDVMVDVAQLLGPRAAARLDVLERHGVAPGGFLLATAHRAGNVDDPARLTALVELLVVRARAGRAAAAPAHRGAPGRRRAARAAGACGRPAHARRSATSTSRRSCTTRARC